MREIRECLVVVMSSGTWSKIEERFALVALDWREDLEPGWGKPKYVKRVLDGLGDDEVLELAERCLELLPAARTPLLRDEVWLQAANRSRLITEITRFAIADGLEGHVLNQHEPLSDFLERTTGRTCPGYEYGADGSIRFSDALELFLANGTSRPATLREVLSSVHFLEWPDERFSLFLEALVRPEVIQGDAQRERVDLLNSILRHDSFALEETERLSGRLVFCVRPVRRGVAGRPKNLVFASNGYKPEIGFVDAINNDIVVLSNESSCLVYEDPIADDGLLWRTLVAWYARKVGLDDESVARRTLGNRLLESLKEPPEQILFKEYFQLFHPRLSDRLPALIPQVYLHYDPKTVAELMGRRRFLVQRMDFLLLLPNRVRVVLEIDGRQHYCDDNGRVSTSRYAETARSGRDLQLAGYEVHRFGGAEFKRDANASEMLHRFFTRLFDRYL